jgi:hypothetical protein
MKWQILLILALVGGIAGGCQKSPQPLSNSRSGEPPVPTHGQPKLQTIDLWIGAEVMSAELALTAEQQRTGMMFRTNQDENAGMLFVFPAPWRAEFWMKNCPLPLSAAYLSPDGVILELHDLEPQSTTSIVAASENVQYVLETSQGWFKRKKIAVGTLVRTEHGSLHETFFRR